MKRLILILCLALSVPVSAQQRPIAATTVQTTDTTANSVLVGCAVGSTTCTGGIKAGAAIFSGLFTDTGLGTHTFTAGGVGGNILRVANTTAGVGNFGGFYVLNDEATSSAGGLIQTSSTYNTAASASFDPPNVASSTNLLGGRAGGLNLYAANGPIRFYVSSATTATWGINTAGDWLRGGTQFADNVGTPTIASGFGSGPAVTGKDYAFYVSVGTAGSTTGTVTFGHSFAAGNIAICTATTDDITKAVAVNPGTANVVLTYTSGSSFHIYVLCRGF